MPDEEKKQTDPQTVTRVIVETHGIYTIFLRSDGLYELWDGERQVGDTYETLDEARLAADIDHLSILIAPPVNEPNDVAPAPEDPAPEASGP